MPVVQVKVIKGVFSAEQKHEMAKKITDAIVEVEGSEAFREFVWVLVEELEDGFHRGGEAMEPEKLQSMLHSKAAM